VTWMNYGGRLKRLAIAGAVGSFDEWTGADAYLKNLSHSYTGMPLISLLVLTPRQYRNFIELFSNLVEIAERCVVVR
jgi:hypothetical protein